jgi:hypothetical protein
MKFGMTIESDAEAVLHKHGYIKSSPFEFKRRSRADEKRTDYEAKNTVITIPQLEDLGLANLPDGRSLTPEEKRNALAQLDALIQSQV